MQLSWPEPHYSETLEMENEKALKGYFQPSVDIEQPQTQNYREFDWALGEPEKWESWDLVDNCWKEKACALCGWVSTTMWNSLKTNSECCPCFRVSLKVTSRAEKRKKNKIQWWKTFPILQTNIGNTIKIFPTVDICTSSFQIGLMLEVKINSAPSWTKSELTW